MKTGNAYLEAFFKKAVTTHTDALKYALENKLVHVDDLDVSNNVHRNVLVDLTSGTLAVPDRFVKSSSARELSALLKHELNVGAAQAEVDARLARKDESLLQHMIDEGMRSGTAYPAKIQKLIAPILADPTKTNDDRWAAARRVLDPALVSEIAKARAMAKRVATVAATVAGERAKVVHTDPLLESIAKGDSNRMHGLGLDTLRPERWEKAKADWLACPTVAVRAYLTRLPLAFVQPHMKAALEAAAEAKLDHWRLPSPKWPVQKAVLKTLVPSAVGYWLTEAANGHITFDAPLTNAELSDDLSPMLVMEALGDSEVGKVMAWIAGLSKARKAMKMSRSEARPTATKDELSMATTVRKTLGGLRHHQNLVSCYADDETNTREAIRWLLGMDEVELARLGLLFLRSQEIIDGMLAMFGADLTKCVNFAEDI